MFDCVRDPAKVGSGISIYWKQLTERNDVDEPDARLASCGELGDSSVCQVDERVGPVRFNRVSVCYL